MTGIGNDTVAGFQARIRRFSPKYAHDWDGWIVTPAGHRAYELKRLLGKWQACRSNPIRDLTGANSSAHAGPYIDGLMLAALPHVVVLNTLDLIHPGHLTSVAETAIKELWVIFEQLSFARQYPPRKRPPPRGGLAGAVGISKAAMLATDGRLGPAFDSRVRKKMGIRKISNATEWLASIRLASLDIQRFCAAHSTTLQAASGLSLHTGRIYDMALGPA
jgi:hypothetical protein